MIILKDEEINPQRELKETIDIIASLSLKYDEVISCVFVSEKRYGSIGKFVRNHIK